FSVLAAASSNAWLAHPASKKPRRVGTAQDARRNPMLIALSLVVGDAASMLHRKIEVTPPPRPSRCSHAHLAPAGFSVALSVPAPCGRVPGTRARPPPRVPLVP